jgi:predicted peptidase
MYSRRDFLSVSAGAGALLAVGVPVFAQGAPSARAAVAITEVFGEGAKLTAVAVEYDTPLRADDLAADAFFVEARTVTGVFTSATVDPAGRAAEGRFVIVTLSPDDPDALLAQRIGQPGGNGSGGGRGPGHAGDIPNYDTVWPPASASVAQTAALTAADGIKVSAADAAIETSGVVNLIVDDFEQREFTEPQTGYVLRYNLFIPKDYDAARRYPLVLFMHDAGATSDQVRTTLFQGLGAISFATPQDQARRPAFVLAPQFAEIIADDDSNTSGALDATIRLIEALGEEFAIDETRRYTTGQSGGCMMSIAMGIKYPDFFAASYLVAGQWNPALVAPMADDKLWILVSQDDAKAYPGQNAITEALEAEGATVSRAAWDARWSAEEFRAAFDALDAEGSSINYVAFEAGTVIPEGESTAGASGHRNTWRVAYTIEPIREWLFRHSR